jgi:hypothetical protein
MRKRAENSGISLTASDASLVKGMLLRGDRQHDIAAYFGVNGGRVAEIARGKAFASVKAARGSELPPSGPYLSGRETSVLLGSISKAKAAISEVEHFLAKVDRAEGQLKFDIKH